MDLNQFAGIPKESGRNEFNRFYDKVIEKLGGVAAVRPYIPFGDDVLSNAYEDDRNFNTDRTPLRAWDRATGIELPAGQSTVRPKITGRGLTRLLMANGIDSVSEAECVCILKRAAERWVVK